MSQSVFWVYQNKTYSEEKNGGFLWSPKYTQDGRRHPGYETMKEVKPGDIIIHGYQSDIVAISVAASACFSCDRPSPEFLDWASDGWKIRCRYFEFSHALPMNSICHTLYDLQPENGPLNRKKTGKQQYLCSANKKMLDCILNAYASTFYGKDQIGLLRQFLQLDDPVVQLSSPGTGDRKQAEVPRIKQIIKRRIEEGCKVAAVILDNNKDTVLTINTTKYPKQKHLIGKVVGEIFELEGIKLKYQITKIWVEKEQ